jgi:hypothetical protein
MSHAAAAGSDRLKRLGTPSPLTAVFRRHDLRRPRPRLRSVRLSFGQDDQPLGTFPTLREAIGAITAPSDSTPAPGDVT